MKKTSNTISIFPCGVAITWNEKTQTFPGKNLKEVSELPPEKFAFPEKQMNDIFGVILRKRYEMEMRK